MVFTTAARYPCYMRKSLSSFRENEAKLVLNCSLNEKRRQRSPEVSKKINQTRSWYPLLN